MNKAKAFTIKDIARECGVSVSSVSYALSGKKGTLSEKTIQKIQKKAKEMRYSPNLHARTLQNGRTNAIGIFVSGFQGIIHNAILAGMASVFRTIDTPYNMIVTFLDRDMHALRNNLVDLSIIMDSKADVEKIKECSKNIPIIDFDLKVIKSPNVYNAMIPNESCLENMCSIMYRNGAKKLAFLSGSSASAHNAERQAGYIKGVRTAPLIFDANSFDENEGYGKIKSELFGLKSLPFDGLVCSNDNLALGALKALDELGFAPRKDFIISGFDNVYRSQTSEPKITTVSIDWFDFGMDIAHLALDILNDKECDDIVSKTSIIERESTSFLR